MGYGDDEYGRKRKTLDDEDAMEDDDVEDDEDEEEGRTAHGRYNRRVVHFIDAEVEVDDDIDDDDDDEAELSDGELIHETAEASAKPSHYRRYEAAREIPEEDDVERLEEYIKKRYHTVEYTADATAANQQSLVPTQLDPKLWVVQCSVGYERQLCLQLMNKSVNFRTKKKTPLLIKSVMSLDHLKGHLYIEADREAHVRDAIEKMRHIQHSKGIKLVPLQDMVATITPNRVAKLAIDVGTWVRIRSGPYAHDLAKVVRVNHALQKVELKVVPRIDYNQLVDRQEKRVSQRGQDSFRSKTKLRPPARPFSSEECRSLGLNVERRRGADGEVYMVVENYLFQDGYLIKTMSMRSIVIENTTPSIEDLRRFDAAAQSNNDFYSASESLPEMLETASVKKHGLFNGDHVTVLNGDMMSMKGIVAEIASDGKISVRMDSRDVHGVIPFDATDLVKRFELGEHVCVREGMRRGQSGMVIKIEERKCLVLSDMDKTEFWVGAKDLSSTQETQFGNDTFGDYEVEDLVELQNRQFGVIIFADRDFCKILLAAGSAEKPEVKRATLQEIKCKSEFRRNATNDLNGNRIVAGDIIDFYMGTRETKASGTVKYISPPYVFAKVRGRRDNLGYIVISSKFCTVRGGKRPSPHSMSDRYTGPRSPCPQDDSWSSYGRRSFGGRSPGRSSRFFLRGRGRAAKKENVMVKVLRGSHRGYHGLVKGETSTHVRVELDAGSKIINVPKDNVEHLDIDMGSYPCDSSAASWRYGGGDGASSYSAAPKTPYGDHHPPTTPYLTTGREILTSPAYTPDQPTQAPEPEPMQQKDDSDDDFDFGGESTSAPVPASVPASTPLTTIAEPAGESSLKSTSTVDLTTLSPSQITDAIVRLSSGTFGVVREVSEAVCQIEHVNMEEYAEERKFHPTGEKQRQTLSEIKSIAAQKEDTVRILDPSENNSIGHVVEVADNDECVIRIKEATDIQIFPNRHIIVILPPSDS